VVCGNYEFSLNVDDTATLVRLGKLGSAANAPFLSQIKPQMFGIESLAEVPETSKWNYSDDSIEGKLWTTLRTISEASFIGLTTPRFLGRLPYGEDTEPTEIFSFEEFTIDNTGDNYLWTNSSFICALLLAQSYSAFGWEMGRSLFQEVEGLPIHMYKVDGELKTKPCAEIEMTHTACDLLLEQGLMPLISFRNTDRVRLGGFQSIAFPAKDLSGRWN
jgi:type VI secretion system protein ImpC